jgi:signal transduction histidine kinase
MNFPYLKHPKSAQAFHVTNTHHHLPDHENKEDVLAQSQDEFLSLASHELRTPLTAIKGNTSLIKQYFWEQIPGGELRGMIGDIDQAADQMLKLVNNILDTLRLEQGLVDFKLQKADLIAIVKDVVSKYQNANSNHELQIILNEPAVSISPVFIDPEWAKKLLSYVLDNAVKSTARGTINVSFFPEQDSVRVAITDTGRGIEQKAQKVLFRKFAQTSENVLTRDSVQGAGLGLYLAKLVSEQMHAGVSLVSSELGRGSTFFISFSTSK